MPSEGLGGNLIGFRLAGCPVIGPWIEIFVTLKGSYEAISCSSTYVRVYRLFIVHPTLISNLQLYLLQKHFKFDILILKDTKILTILLKKLGESRTRLITITNCIKNFYFI